MMPSIPFSRRVLILFSTLLLTMAMVPCSAAQSADQANPDEVRAHLKKGDALLEQQDWDGALQEYQAAVQLAPDHAEAHVGVGRALGEKGKRDDALKEFHEALRLNPNLAEAHNGVGWILGEKGDVDGAMKEYREAIRLKPDYARAHSNLGWGYSEQGDFDAALREYREAIRLKPSDTYSHEGVAWVLSQKGDWKGALAEYQQAIRLKPNDPEPHLTLGSALAERKDFDGAMREFREAVRLKPDSAEAHTNVGRVLGRKGDSEGAIREYREAIRLHPDYAQAHNYLAIALSHQGDWDGMIREAREAIRLQEDYALGHYTLGRGLEHQGDRKAALEEFRKARKLDPRNEVYSTNFDRLSSELTFLPGNWSPAMLRAFTLAAALVPSFLLLGYFRARDLYPEPGRALWATFGLGVIIVFPVLMIDYPLDFIVQLFHGPITHGLAEALFTAALPEELLKFAVVVLFCARMKAFNEPMDGIVYGAVASLGFATFENVGYVTENGIGVAIARSLTSVPGHAFMGAVMGYFVGQWRFGPATGRSAALVKGYLVPVSLHWMYDFPLLAHAAADRLPGPARAAALAETEPMMILSVIILILESFWAVRLVNRLRREQIQIARDAISEAAAAEGAMDIVAVVNAPEAPPSAWLGWLMALLGGLVATFGAFICFFVMIYFLESLAHREASFDYFSASLVGGIPLLIGLVLFVYGVRRIHASHRGVAAPPLAAPASA